MSKILKIIKIQKLKYAIDIFKDNVIIKVGKNNIYIKF